MHLVISITMWGKKVEEKKSKFFDGINLIGCAIESIYGKAKGIIAGLNNNSDNKDYNLPKIIVIGNESSGKSSLLENITKCQIFPRDTKMCTKCPIHVVMTCGKKEFYTLKFRDNTFTLEKENIYSKVIEIFQSFNDDDVVFDEITINIHRPGIADFEFYDLPGIRAYPPKSASETTELCSKYLKDPNTIILCVVPVTQTRLTACQSIALISEFKREKDSILALTMLDRLQPENIEELLIDRITDHSDELKTLHFSNVVGIINRNHKNTVSMEKHDNVENEWILENIIDKIPETFCKYKREKIMKSLGIDNLLTCINNKYNNFIREDWRPRILKQIEKEDEELMIKYKALGPQPVDNEFLTKCLIAYIKSDICKEFKKLFCNVNVKTIIIDGVDGVDDNDDEDDEDDKDDNDDEDHNDDDDEDHNDNADDFFYSNSVDCVIDKINKIEQELIAYFFNNEKADNIIKKLINEFFYSNKVPRYYNMKRFSMAHDFILSFLTHRYYEHIDNEKDKIVEIIKSFIYTPTINLNFLFFSKVILPFLSVTTDDLLGLTFEENEETMKDRKCIEEKLMFLRSNSVTISEI